jgi:Flp pilus assembly protein TadG
MTTREPTAGRPQAGSASVELVLITPVLVLLLLFVVAGGRVSSAQGEVEAAARDAARAAANARSPLAARQAGAGAARAALDVGTLTCRQLDVSIDVAAFRAGGTVRATVRCTAELSDLTGLGVPGARSVHATFTAPVDTYRGVRS